MIKRIAGQRVVKWRRAVSPEGCVWARLTMGQWIHAGRTSAAMAVSGQWATRQYPRLDSFQGRVLPQGTRPGYTGDSDPAKWGAAGTRAAGVVREMGSGGMQAALPGHKVDLTGAMTDAPSLPLSWHEFWTGLRL